MASDEKNQDPRVAIARVIQLPFPNNLTAHNQGNWRDKEKAVKNNRALAKLTALNQLASGAKAIIGKHKIGYRFYVPDNRRRDVANLIQQCKPYIDGIVDSGIIEGDHWQISEVWFATVEISKENPRVEIQIVGFSKDCE